MIRGEDLEAYLRPYMAEQSMVEYRKQYFRWRSRLAELGIVSVPPFPATTSEEVRATNHLLLLIRQGASIRDSAWEHNQRNLTGVRPFKR